MVVSPRLAMLRFHRESVQFKQTKLDMSEREMVMKQNAWVKGFASTVK
jgi:hypothetical protein